MLTLSQHYVTMKMKSRIEEVNNLTGINHKLKGARVEKGLTQEDMAERIGISTYSYLMKENGKRDFTLTEMKKICEILDKELSEIF